MQFDWFTFTAQIINFAILLILLQRFLYRPILKTMQARQELISSQFAEAESQAKEAHREAELFHKKRIDLENQRELLQNDAQRDAQEQRKQMLEQARAEVDEQREGWRGRLKQDQIAYLDELRQRTSKQVFAIVRHALTDLADVTLEQQMVAVFCKRLRQLETSELEMLNQALQDSRRQITVRTAFVLEQPQREMLSKQLHELFRNGLSHNRLSHNRLSHNGDDGSTQRHDDHPQDVPTLLVDFEEATDLACGIELQAFGHSIEWSLEEYVDRLEDRVEPSL